MTLALILLGWAVLAGLVLAVGALLERRTNQLNEHVHRGEHELTQTEADRLTCTEIERATVLAQSARGERTPIPTTASSRTG